MRTIAIALAGSGGSGVMTVGELLLDAAAGAGWYGRFSRLSGPQIRGGEAAALLQLSAAPVTTVCDRFDALCAIDWGNVERFAAEIPLGPASVLLADPRAGDVPAAIAASGARPVTLPLAEVAGGVSGGRPNMVALGTLAALLGIAPDALDAAVARRLADKGEQALRASRAAMAAGAAAAAGLDVDLRLPPPRPAPGRWLMSGNQAVAVGALRGGIRFVAAYPITPATEIVEWLAPALPRLGGRVVQAEDELAALNLALGASFGGVPAMTATSGPGLSLMVETLGLAVAAEIPLLVVNVQRGGPSTGIPTKSEQADLNLAVYGVHGDAPHVVVAPLSVADAIGTTQWAVELAETLQVPVILLSDQAIGQTRMVIDAPPPAAPPARRLTTAAGGDGYRRYAVTPSGISPMAVPGTAGRAWVADGLEHSERGAPSSAARDHLLQLDKRAAKLEQFDFGDRWAEIDGDGDLVLLTWGSPTAAAREAVARARGDGLAVKHVALRLLAPVPRARLLAALAGARRVLLIEQNHGGQLLHLLRAHAALPADVRHIARPGPLPLRADEIHRALRDLA